MDRKREIRTKIMEMLRKPGFPSDVCFADISCFNEKLISGLRRKIKEVIDRQGEGADREGGGRRGTGEECQRDRGGGGGGGGTGREEYL